MLCSNCGDPFQFHTGDHFQFYTVWESGNVGPTSKLIGCKSYFVIDADSYILSHVVIK